MTRKIIGNERGSVMSIALLFLILLTSLVMFMSRSSTTNVQIAGNEKAAAVAFYAADAGAYASAKVVGKAVIGRRGVLLLRRELLSRSISGQPTGICDGEAGINKTGAKNEEPIHLHHPIDHVGDTNQSIYQEYRKGWSHFHNLACSHDSFNQLLCLNCG